VIGLPQIAAACGLLLGHRRHRNQIKLRFTKYRCTNKKLHVTPVQMLASLLFHLLSLSLSLISGVSGGGRQHSASRIHVAAVITINRSRYAASRPINSFEPSEEIFEFTHNKA
jgi:hypothetical protein